MNPYALSSQSGDWYSAYLKTGKLGKWFTFNDSIVFTNSTMYWNKRNTNISEVTVSGDKSTSEIFVHKARHWAHYHVWFQNIFE